ncbi:lysophospholipase L1-like esterase [Tamaricihabitans halophyticus]|uniref:Lysophospholipase L1-like esterase n=1 Tax=Tamaricihabitans halophyticus TaxID=1262583 RepID=A0A4R2R3U1_9PSEU|nr:SGNH/GDSL hydrolase family protein [Tamaricihabitans halophyticus]TCP57512.1 lysophospholipase L1-like esterase [Tamaricihabitans halophyticus]
MVQQRFSRYVALGDSQTEGLNDGDDSIGYRGWADRLAEQLSQHNPDFQYANLAVRGKLAGQIRQGQLDRAVALRPDLATVVGGMNDLLRRRFDAEQVVAELSAMFAALTGIGARVVTLTYPDIGKIVPIARPLLPRVIELNARIAAAAQSYGVAVVDTFSHPITTDARIWSADRLHANPLGHARIAAAMAHALELPDSDASWTEPLPPLPPPNRWQAARAELRWVGAFAGPWLGRRIRGRSSGDGRAAKRPELRPL